MRKFVHMLERWFGNSKNQNTIDQESYTKRLGLDSFSERQRKELEIRKKVEVELNRPDLEDVSKSIWNLRRHLSVAEPLDAYIQSDPEKAIVIRSEIDKIMTERGLELSDYLKLKRVKCEEEGLLNPGEMDYESAKALADKGLMGENWSEWRWENRVN